MRKKTLYIILGILVLLISLVFVKKGFGGRGGGWLGGADAVEVDTTRVQRRAIAQIISASGTIYPIEELRIAPDIAGEVTDILVEEGDSVRVGQLLARIDPANFINALSQQEAALEQSRARVMQAEAGLEIAEANFRNTTLDYERQKKLFEEKVISEANFQNAEAKYIVDKQNVESAKQQLSAMKYSLRMTAASVQDARENLRQASLLSPINGVITKKLVKIGERVVGTQQMAGTTMFHIADLSSMELRVNIIENDIMRLKKYDSARITLESLPEEELKGIVTSLAIAANTKTSIAEVTEYSVKIRVLRDSYADLIDKFAPSNPLLPGMTASVEIITEQKENVLSIPLVAATTRDLFRKQSKKRGEKRGNNREKTGSTENSSSNKNRVEVVFVYKDDRAEIRHIQTGINDIDFIEVIKGLGEGEVIISGPYLAISRTLKHGDPVSVNITEERRLP